MFHKGFRHLSQQQSTFYFRTKLENSVECLTTIHLLLCLFVIENLIQIPNIWYQFILINGVSMISLLMASSKNVKVSQKRCLETSKKALLALLQVNRL